MRRQTKLNEALEQVAPAERVRRRSGAYEGSLSKQKAKLMEAALQKRFLFQAHQVLSFQFIHQFMIPFCTLHVVVNVDPGSSPG